MPRGEFVPGWLDTKVGELELKQGARGMLDVIMQGSRANDFTLREAGRCYGYTRMNPLLVGTAETIADRLQDLFESDCCDGFMLCPSLTPSGYEEFCQMVVPELQRRELFRREYGGNPWGEDGRWAGPLASSWHGGLTKRWPLQRWPLPRRPDMPTPCRLTAAAGRRTGGIAP